MWKLGEPLLLSTKNYFMQSLTPEMVPDDVERWFADEEITDFTDVPLNSTRQQFQAHVRTFDNKTKWILGIWDKSNNKLIGFYRVYIEVSNSCAKTSVLIGEKDYWGRGVVIETRRRLLDVLLISLNLHKVTAKVFARNFAAIFNYKKMGFVKEGVRRQHVPGRGGVWHDIVAFGLLQDEWKEIRAAEKKKEKK